MTTLAHDVTKQLANTWETYYRSAVISGIVGDKTHQDRGGYHISIENNPSGNYSIVRADDKAPPGSWPKNLASAIDMSLSLSDMKVCHGRLKVAYFDKSDPRRVFINAFNGWDGNDSPGRYDIVTNTISTATDDHKWHVHLEIRRKYATSTHAMHAILSILRGESKQEYLGGVVATLTDYHINAIEYMDRRIEAIARMLDKYSDGPEEGQIPPIIPKLKQLFIDAASSKADTAILKTEAATLKSAVAELKANINTTNSNILALKTLVESWQELDYDKLAKALLHNINN